MKQSLIVAFVPLPLIPLALRLENEQAPENALRPFTARKITVGVRFSAGRNVGLVSLFGSADVRTMFLPRKLTVST